MTITINDMIAVNRFIDAHRGDKLNIKTAFKFNKLASSMEADMRLFQEKYSAIVAAHTEPNTDEGAQEGTFHIKEDHFNDYIREMDELAAVEIEVADVMFDLEEFGDITLTFDELRPIMKFIAD